MRRKPQICMTAPDFFSQNFEYEVHQVGPKEEGKLWHDTNFSVQRRVADGISFFVSLFIIY
jgi:hypothetical protein